MAGKTTRPNGHTWITVKAANGKRRHVRLGLLSEDDSEEARRRLAKIERHYHEKEPIDAMTQAWLHSLTQKYRARVVATGLVDGVGEAALPTVADTSVEKLTTEWLATCDVAQSTADNYQQTVDLVIRYFGRDRCVKGVTAADADKFVAWAIQHGRVKGDAPMARASISRGSRTVRRIFQFAVKLRWVKENPFAHVRSQGEINQERWWYITPALVDALIDECPHPELRAMIGLSYCATFRGPSEFSRLRWEDISWEVPDIKITATKTMRYSTGGLRVSPLEGHALQQVRQLWEAAEVGEPMVLPKLGRAHGSDISARLERVCRRVGVPLWEKPWTNLRASCETNWQKAGFSIFDTSDWMGHSPAVALAHYKRVASHVADLPASRKGEALRHPRGPKGESKGETLRGSELES